MCSLLHGGGVCRSRNPIATVDRRGESLYCVASAEEQDSHDSEADCHCDQCTHCFFSLAPLNQTFPLTQVYDGDTTRPPYPSRRARAYDVVADTSTRSRRQSVRYRNGDRSKRRKSTIDLTDANSSEITLRLGAHTTGRWTHRSPVRDRGRLRWGL